MMISGNAGEENGTLLSTGWGSESKFLKSIMPNTKKQGINACNDNIHVNDDNKIIIWNSDSYELVCILEGHLNSIWTLTFISESILASGGADGQIRIWNLEMGICTNVVDGHNGVITEIFYIRESNILISCGLDEKIKL